MVVLTPIDTVRAEFARAQERQQNLRVSWEVRSSYHTIAYRGVVTEVTPATVVVVEDRNKAVHRFRARRGAHIAGKVDLAILTPHQLALEDWARQVPDTSLISVHTHSLGGRWDWGDPMTVAITQPGKMNPIEYLAKLQPQLSMIKLWLERRPVEA